MVARKKTDVVTDIRKTGKGIGRNVRGNTTPALADSRLVPMTWTESRQMTPMMPKLDEEWSILTTALTQEATRLDSALPPRTRHALTPLLRQVNSYYSNLIEGHRTLPGDVAAAMRRASATGPKKEQHLVIEALAHIQVQSEIEREMAGHGFQPTDPANIRRIHRLFIEQLPEEMQWTEPRSNGTRERIIPGLFRREPVLVGAHIPPAAEHLEAFLEAFNGAYKSHAAPTPETVGRIAAAHQRFMWIHPFLDGNGRVGRLMTDAMFANAGLAADGLWRISRGFARRNTDYKSRLAEADEDRHGDLDGRGNLSQRGMDNWCKFVVEVALDQVKFMRQLLSVEKLPMRIQEWSARSFPSKASTRIGLLMERVIRYGEVDRKTVYELLGVTERHARRLIDRLIKEELVEVTMSGALTPRIHLSVVPSWFPDLFPANERDEMEATRITVTDD